MKTHKIRQTLFGSVLAAALACWLLTVAGGQTNEQTTERAGPSRKAARRAAAAEAGVDLPNFGRVNNHYFRGAQPHARQYDDLKHIGVKTIIDLRDDARPYAKEAAEQAGLRYINLPLNDKRYPPEDAAARFLKVANEQANWPVYVHCAGGRHRTGAMTAIYRMTVDGWDINRAYAEMKQYDFYTRNGHQPYKAYVYDYYRDLHLARLAPNKAGTGQAGNASRADLQAYGRLNAGQRTLFDCWAAEHNRAQGTNLQPAALYAALTHSQRTTYEAVTHALSQSKLTNQDERPLRQNALALVTGLTEIAGEMKGVGGDKQFRLYVQLAPDAQEVLTQAREFFRDKDNTVFHREYPHNFRQRGRTPTLQFSIAKDATRADIDVDYRSSRVPKALINGHLRAANSDVRAGGNYFGHIRRWFGLLRWWRFGLDEEERPVAQSVAPRRAPASASSPANSSAPTPHTQLTAQQLAEARQVAAAAHEFLTAWLLRRDAKRADDYLTKRPVACLSVDEDEENEVVTSSVALRNFAQLLQASLRAQAKRAALADAVAALEPWDPELVFAEHPHQQLFALRGIQRDEAAEFMCAQGRMAGDPNAYGEFYATYFTLKLERDNESGLALLWTKEDGRWQIVSYEVLEP